MSKHTALVWLISLGLGLSQPLYAESIIPNNLHLSPFNYYGKSRIGLFKWDNECVISIAGRDEEGNPTSIALWLPDKPNTLFIFPEMTNVDDGVILLSYYLNSKPLEFKYTNDTLQFQSMTYRLSVKNDFPMLFTDFMENPTPKFLTANNFTVNVSAYTNTIKNIQFDLTGLNQAIDAYKTYCSDK